MKDDLDSETVTGSSPSASWFDRHLPVWSSIVSLREQVDGLRQQLEDADARLLDSSKRIDYTHELLDETNARLLDSSKRIDYTHGLIDETNSRLVESSLRIDQTQEDVRESEARVADIATELCAFQRQLGHSVRDLQRLDAWYQDLQELHRGSHESLLEVQKSYVTHFREREWLSVDGPIFDLGCGRGEWLSMMREEGWAVRGVDSSEQAVAEGRELGLDVELGDLVDALEACPENALAGVTAFQVIEHLPFSRIISLMFAAYRALVPGGILLLETPNPENLQVATYSFWMDPTHRHPIPPPLIMDLTFHVGFRDGSILRKNPWPQWRDKDPETSLESEVSYRLFGPQDYAVLVYKPASSA